ncbi:MAG: hypothetical protein ACR2QK_16425 [Acidimicrobiales bacterium]
MTLQHSIHRTLKTNLPSPASLSVMGRVGLTLALMSVVLGIWGGIRVPSSEVDGYGILFALPTIYWVAVGLGTVASFVLLRTALVERTRYAAVVPPMWLGILHTAPHLAHDQFRFQTVWTHVGFVRVIDETGSGDVLIDARFAWPGFFGVFMAPLANVNEQTLDIIMRLWPTAVLRATAILVSALATRGSPTVPLIGPLSAVAYILLAWTGQDYFSPQSFGFTAYLAMLVLLESGPLRTSPALSASVPFLARFAAAGGDRPTARSTPVFVALIILSFGSIVSHPLAPFFICMGMVILGLYGRTVAWRLLVLIAVAYVMWFFITAEPWWTTQLDKMVGQIGSFFTNLESSTTSRVATSSPEHVFVAAVRTWVGIGTFLSVLAIGVAMATERFRHLRPAVPLAPLAGIPSMALVLQSYGGEIVFRVVLFTLPMAAILIGRVLATVRVRALPVLVPAFVLALLPLLMLSRFGNEAFEMTTDVDREVIEASYERAQDDTLFVLDNGFAPYQDRTVGRNRFAQIAAEPTEEWVQKLEDRAVEFDTPRIIVMFTPSQSQWRVHGMSFSEDYLDEVGEWLEQRPGTTVLYKNGGGWAIEL